MSNTAPTDNPLSLSHCLHENFAYATRNPYHQKLEEFDEFVLRDLQGESFKGKWNQEIFKNNFPIHMEVGTGYGHFMLDFLKSHENINFIGMDYRFKRSYQLACKLSKFGQKNFRLLRAKGERVHFLFDKNEVDNLYYFFPDPWPKKRHHKKRLFQETFLKSCHHILKSDGHFYIKTDHDELFEWMLEVVKNSPYFTSCFQSTHLWNEYPDHFLCQFQTKFEKIFISQGVKIKALVLRPSSTYESIDT